MVSRRNLIAKVLLAIIVFALFLFVSPRAQAQDVTVTQDDWRACLTYQAKYRDNQETIRRLGKLVEQEKHAASFCTGLYQAAVADLDRERAKVRVTEMSKSWVVFASLVVSGASAASGAFLVSDFPLAGGVLIGAGSVGIILNGVFW